MRRELHSLVSKMVKAKIPLEMAMQEFEIAFLREVISSNGGNCSAAARQLGMHRNTLSKKVGQNVEPLRYHDVARPDSSAGPSA